MSWCRSLNTSNMFPEDEPNYCIVCRGHVGPGNVILLFLAVINVLNVDKKNMHLDGDVQTNDNLCQS